MANLHANRQDDPRKNIFYWIFTFSMLSGGRKKTVDTKFYIFF